MASESVVAVMQLLARFRFVPSDVIREECFSGYKTESQMRIANRTLKQLRDRGLVDSEIVFGRTWVHWLTEEGARANDVEGGRGVGPKLAEYEHDLSIIKLWQVLREDPRVERIVTEREARSEGPDPSENEWAIPITRQSGTKGYAWPDLITIGSNGRWGHEVEWTRKNKQRLRLLMLAYGRDARYSGGIYYSTRANHAVITECAEIVNERLAEGGYGRQIITWELADKLEEKGEAR